MTTTHSKLKKAPAVNPENILWGLISAPEDLARAEKRRDLARLDHDSYLAGLALEALTRPLFPDSKNPDVKRAPANESERKAAVDLIVADEPEYKRLRQEFEAAQREVNLVRNRLESLQLAARLMISQNKQ